MVSQYFSADYNEARAKFLSVAEKVGASVENRLNSNATGPDGEALYTDVARFGPDDAKKILVIISGTHGNEGFCGSGCQIGYLEEGRHLERDEDTALIFVHAINPYGFANVRRVTEDNVDLNRNFVDHGKPYSDNAGYEHIHEFVVPETWGGEVLAAANKGLADYAKEHGAMGLQSAMSGGQHTHPGGVFFAGTEPTWSNTTLRSIISDHMSGAEHIALIDFHTGLGPNGHGELILNGDFEGSYERAQGWYNNEVTSFEDGSSTSAKLTGMMCFAFLDIFAPEQLTGIAVEYGTYDTGTVLTALRFDNWINQNEKPGTALWAEGKKAIRDALYCDNDEWKAKVFERANWVLDHAYLGLKTV